MSIISVIAYLKNGHNWFLLSTLLSFPYQKVKTGFRLSWIKASLWLLWPVEYSRSNAILVLVLGFKRIDISVSPLGVLNLHIRCLTALFVKETIYRNSMERKDYMGKHVYYKLYNMILYIIIIYVYMCVYAHVYTHIPIYVYICIQRETERERRLFQNLEWIQPSNYSHQDTRPVREPFLDSPHKLSHQPIITEWPQLTL